MSGAFNVRGGDQLQATLRQAGEDLGDLAAPSKRAGDLVVGAARGRAPKRSGVLAASLFPVVSATGVTVSSRLPYAGPIHWGWPARRIAAQPFLVDAAARTEDTWVGYYADAVQGALDGVKGA